MFQLKNQRMTLTKVTTFAENHGQDVVHGQSLKVKLTVPNTLLDDFEEGLCEAFFKRGKEEDHDLAEQGQPDALPRLRFPELQPVSYGWEGMGYRVTVHQGFSGDEDINLIQCKLDAFTFALKDGGSVEMSFNIKCHPNSEESGALDHLMKEEIDVSLQPPSAEERAQMELDAMSGDDEEEEQEAA